MSDALSIREREVINLSNLNIPPPRPVINRLICRIFSKKGYNPKTLKNFITKQWVGRFAVAISDYDASTDSYTVSFGCEGDLKRVLAKEPWNFHNLHMILCPPSVLQNATLESYTLTPFWIQVFRLPFLSKTEALAKILGNMIGKFLEVFEDSLNEGWGPFLRMRVEIDVSKPLLRGQLVTFPWMNDELWIDYRYERLPDFCYECGIIGHVFDKCSLFLEKLDEGVEPNLPYGPWMEGSSLPRSSYDRYRQDFSKEGPWPFLTRLARNTINPILEHPRHLPAAPSNVTSSEKGKQVLDATNIIESNNMNLHSLKLTGVSSQSPKRLSIKDHASSSCSKEIPIDKLSPSTHGGSSTPASTNEYSSRSAATCPTVPHITPNINSSLPSPPVATYPPLTSTHFKKPISLSMPIPPAYIHMSTEFNPSFTMSSSTVISASTAATSPPVTENRVAQEVLH
ncbi:hypothetical protein G4B88_018336 [Cannabis sativa]|uniref:Zinc knuckle CX2CX4HX4C domain-containing protein n=1 Tax=Cannabis sativa TaxID=3483 RepID=A0A7J6EWF9_CANSA|nr:hypothetical protein G4B88_018336 [Cannabis sativa]